eukprot:5661662-Pleurochrysis_carterae.AAC.3
MQSLTQQLEAGRLELLSYLKERGLSLPARQKVANALAKAVKAQQIETETVVYASSPPPQHPSMPPPSLAHVDRMRRKSSSGSSAGGSTKWLLKQANSSKLLNHGMRLVPNTRPEIMLFGDSITQRGFEPGQWAARLANYYQRTADIVLRGYNGYNTNWLMPLLPKLFPLNRAAPALVIIQFGTNDSARPPPVPGHLPAASRQRVPIDEFESNLSAVVNTIVNCGAGTAKMLILAPLPVDDAAYLKMQPKTDTSSAKHESIRTNAHTGEYASACVRVGSRMEVPVLDLWHEMQRDRSWRGLLRDGLHPNDKGAELMFNLIKRAITANFPELVPSAFEDPKPFGKLQPDFPDHKSIQPDDPERWFRLHAMALALGKPVPRTERDVIREMGR